MSGKRSWRQQDIRVEVDQSTVGNPGAAPSSYIFQAILLTAHMTGAFEVGWAFPWNSDTTADSVTLAVKAVGWNKAHWAAIATTGNIALTGASSVGGVGAGAGPAINGGSAPGVYQCTAAGTTISVNVTGASSSTSTLVSAAYPTLTGLLSAQGMQDNGGSALVTDLADTTTFAIGSPVLIEFLVSATHSISMTGSASFWARELTA
jgi:hypothetical protein